LGHHRFLFRPSSPPVRAVAASYLSEARAQGVSLSVFKDHRRLRRDSAWIHHWSLLCSADLLHPGTVLHQVIAVVASALIYVRTKPLLCQLDLFLSWLGSSTGSTNLSIGLAH
jgi:hypothetical protein